MKNSPVIALYCSQGHPNPTSHKFCEVCGQPLQTQNMPLSPGMILGINGKDPNGFRYCIIRQLGQGGFGRTYLAEDLNRFNELCVLKEFAPKINNSAKVQQKAQELFEREAQTLHKLQHHQIPRFRELFKFNQSGTNRLFLVQDYVHGITFRHLLETRKNQGTTFTESEITQLLLQLLPVLQYIHSLGVIHRDISPENIIQRTADGLAVLIDFGGVRHIAHSIEVQFNNNVQGLSDPTRVGKKGYAPPEQLRLGIVSPRSDIYSLGVSCLVLLTGKEPSSLIDQKTLDWKWDQIELSPRLNYILSKMVAVSSDDPYLEAREVLVDLNNINNLAVSFLNTSVRIDDEYNYVTLPPEEKVATTDESIPDDMNGDDVKVQRWSMFNFLKKALVVLLVMGISGTIGWNVGYYWVQEQIAKNLKNIPDFERSELDPLTPTFQRDPNDKFEQGRRDAINRRRADLDINEDFFNSLVAQVLELENPRLKGKTISVDSSDQELFDLWNKTAQDILHKFQKNQFSRRQYRRMGSYDRQDLEWLVNAANKVRLSSKALYDLMDSKYYSMFSKYNANQLNVSLSEFIKQPLGQVWIAAGSQQVRALQSGTILEGISVSANGSVERMVTMKPGDGRAYTLKADAGKLVRLKLDAPTSVKLSIYSPSGKDQILDDSTERTWEGVISEGGVYEITITSFDTQKVEYKLSISSDES